MNGQPRGEAGEDEVRPEPEIPEGWPPKLPFRKRPKPYSRAISWAPVPSRPSLAVPEPRPDRHRPYELFVAQAALRDIRQHLVPATTPEPFGFLIGQVNFCPWTELPYVLIDAVRRETDSLPSSSEIDRFRHAWLAAAKDARHRRAELIGWYHRHGVLGLRMSEWDLKLQDEFFPEPWQCALIIAWSDGPIGGWIQRSHHARLFRKGIAPFHELVELDAKLIEGLRASVVDWKNYAPSQPVRVIAVDWPQPEVRARPARDEGHERESDLPEHEETPSLVGVLAFPSRSGETAAPAQAEPEKSAEPQPEEAAEAVEASAEEAVAEGAPESEAEDIAQPEPPAVSETEPEETAEPKPAEVASAETEKAAEPEPAEEAESEPAEGDEEDAGAAAEPEPAEVAAESDPAEAAAPEEAEPEDEPADDAPVVETGISADDEAPAEPEETEAAEP
ncbi:MAG: hypothetical protein R3266_14635, partial [Gemmatimonadota bacterium]|nr:hypothetical protein [Gemmatimonadota bacterium]